MLDDKFLLDVNSQDGSTSAEPCSLSDHSLFIESTLCRQLNLSRLAADELLALTKLSQVERKRQGVFFTPAELSRLSIEKFGYSPSDGAVLDPACGSGNLLLALANTFEVSESLEATLVGWNSKLHGIDINESFVSIARKKLVKLALNKGALPTDKKTSDEILSILSNIRVGDFLKEYQSYFGKIGGVIMNPPFCHIEASRNIDWTSGRFNAASLFVIYATEILPIGGRILGILPDVLRSGTRYAQWRQRMSKKVEYTMDTFGSFESGVQVDVFIMQGKKKCFQGKALDEQAVATNSTNTLLMDKFDVSVGPVVPHRDKAIGIAAPFAHAKVLPVWETVNMLPERICHSGRKIQPPFVAVRRTSSPKDRYRIVGTVVNCKEPVAVENHIIILAPKDRSLLSCQSILEFFRTEDANNYVNEKIRCRHLTVGVLKAMPIGGESDGI